MSKQYIVFTGIGKTTFCKTHLNWVDLDIGWWENIMQDAHAVSNLFYFYPRWGYNILIAGTRSALRYISYHKANVLMKLMPNFVPLKVNIIIPCPEMKAEILERIASRGCAQDLKYLTNAYDQNWEALDNAPFDTKVYLKPGQYLSDIIDENGEYKPGIDIIYGK
ncbi:MAG: hypothetical protein J6Z11_13700 [Candidatus Riflebacteria bacterium]|nr:hypothetical protein [Candidatus Riflebacteria bacterium]